MKGTVEATEALKKLYEPWTGMNALASGMVAGVRVEGDTVYLRLGFGLPESRCPCDILTGSFFVDSFKERLRRHLKRAGFREVRFEEQGGPV